jgi:hypothetical protein
MADQANATSHGDLFTMETAGLPEASRPAVTRLGDGGQLELRIGPVRTNIDAAELRMLGYQGSIPGPVLHFEQGSQMTVQVTDDGDVEATGEHNQGGMMFSCNVARRPVPAR